MPGNRSACPVQLRANLSQLADSGTLRSPDRINYEGDQIYAVKTRGGLRAYGWFCHLEGRKGFAISHVTLKRKQKLDPKDRARALEAKRLFEERPPKDL